MPASQLEMRLPSPIKPEVMIGAASPLWGYFTGAAMAGVAWWWMARLMRPSNLEPMFAAATPRLAKLPSDSVTVALVAAELPALPVGGEAAPFGAVTLEAELLEADVSEAEFMVEPELAADLVADDPAELAPQPEPRPKPRKAKVETEPKPH